MKILLLILFFTTTVYGKNFGVVGDVYPVKEQSLLALIRSKAAALNMNSIENHIKEKINSHVKRPNSLGLLRAMKTTAHFYNPIFVLNKNIYDAKGKLLYPKGFSVNPLLKLKDYYPVWLFLNGDDKAQRLWAKKILIRHPNAKIILTQGDVEVTEAQFNRAIYFDQASVISRKLKITQVPTLVERKGDALLVTSFHIKENGDEF